MPTDSSLLTAEDIKGIIKVCFDNGVKKFAYQGLALDFGEPPSTITAPSQEVPLMEPLVDHKAQDRAYLEEEDVKTRQERVAMAIIEDPSLAEQLLMDGDLIDGDGDDGESD